MFYLRITLSGVCLFYLLPTMRHLQLFLLLLSFLFLFPWCCFECDGSQVSCYQERSGMLHLRVWWAPRL